MKHGRRGLDGATNGDPARVAPHLFVGTTLISRDVNLLRAIGITHVLNAAGMSDWTGSRLGLTLMQRNIADESDQPLAPHLQKTFDFIEQARASGGACFVCSDRGVSRSSAIAAYYLMRSEKMSFTDAMSEIIDVRACCCPNSGFVTELNALSDSFEQPRTTSRRAGLRGTASPPTQLPLLSDAARRARDARSLRGDAGTRWRVGIDPKQGHVVRVGIETQGFRAGGGSTPRGGGGGGGGGTQAAWGGGSSPRRDAMEQQRRRKEAREMEELLAAQWEQEQAQAQAQAQARRLGSPRDTAAGGSFGGLFLPPSPRQRGSSGPRGLATGCTIGSHRGCLCQICFINDKPARARSARIKAEMAIHPDLAALSSFS